MAYPVETILAEKYETILKRNILNTRARDLYNLYMLYHLYYSRIEVKTLALAIENTAKIRNSLEEIRLYEHMAYHLAYLKPRSSSVLPLLNYYLTKHTRAD